MKFHITGHTGYVGSHLTHMLDMLNVNYVGEDLEPINTNRNRIMGLCRLPSDAFIHLAAKISVSESNFKPSEYVDTNLSLLSDILKTVNTKHFIFISSITASKPDNVYAYTKLLGEKMVEQSGIPYTILRPTNIAGTIPEVAKVSLNHIIGSLCLAVKEGRPLEIYGNDYETGDGTCIRNYIHVMDLVSDIFQFACTVPTNQVYECSGNRNYSNLAIAKLIEKIHGSPLEIVFKPRREGDIGNYYIKPFDEFPRRDIDNIVKSVYNTIMAK